MIRFSPLLLAAALTACASAAQQSEPPITAATPVGPVPPAALATPAVGDVAPDFRFVAITQDGIGKPMKLSDYRGQTVVLWLFIKARTRG